MNEDNKNRNIENQPIDPECFQLTHDICEYMKDSKGSVCCLAQHKEIKNLYCIITAGHLFTNKKYIHYGFQKGRDVSSNKIVIGDLLYQTMNPECDFALVKLKKEPDVNQWHCFNNRFYDSRCTSREVQILKKNGIIFDAFIIEEDATVEMHFENDKGGDEYHKFHGIMKIGSTPNLPCNAVSKGGDSGACVIHKKTGRLIGLIMGIITDFERNSQFTIVLPIEHILKHLKENYDIL